MKKVLIIDDEPLARSVVIEYLRDYPEIEISAECNNGFEGIKAIAEHKPDLIFLDIQMPKINGFEMLEIIEKPPAVIFTTAFDEYALKAFEKNSIDYLLKPFGKDRFKNAIQKWQNNSGSIENPIKELLESSSRQPEERNRVVVKHGSDIVIIPVQEIIYIEAYDDYVKIFTKNKFYVKKQTVNYYENTLDASMFFRTHRSYIINLQYLTKIEALEKNTYIALLKEGFKIPLSRMGYSKLRDSLGL